MRLAVWFTPLSVTGLLATAMIAAPAASEDAGKGKPASLTLKRGKNNAEARTYAPANTKYTNVKLNRASGAAPATDDEVLVGMEHGDAVRAPAGKSSNWVRVQQPGVAQGGAALELQGINGESQAQDGRNQHIEVVSYSFGPMKNHSSGGFNEMSMDDTAGSEPAQAGGGHSMLGASDRMSGQAADPAAGQATGKRQHKPFVMRGSYDQPIGTGAGSLTVQGNVPGCTVGKRYAGMQFAGGGQTYQLQDVEVTSCTGGQTTFAYRKVTVRGWDPEKKEQ
jgi:hypothetical protein